ncbi:MAG: hypothetical protein QGF32_04775 [Candidatus Thalassarchaeaceae archaeon]|jgi:hypothetical protein|nr:hypothetical protein [Candidatus Thalassarchaeaceae archaeon]
MSQEDGKADRIDPISGAKVGEYVETAGAPTSQSVGLLEKASEQSHWSQDAIISDDGGQKESQPAVGPVEALKAVFLFGIMPLIVFRVILVYLPFGIDEMMVPGTSFSLVMALLFISSFAFVFWRLGLVTTTGLAVSGPGALAASLVAISYLLMLLLPLVLGFVLEGELSVGQIEYSEDGETITVNILQTTLSDRELEAGLVVLQSGDQVWSSTANVIIDSSDGEGEITIQVSEFYTSNALPNSPYSLKLTLDGKEYTRDLTYSTIQWDSSQWTGADALTLDITGVDGIARGVVKEDPDRCSGDAENCLVGVVMSGWSGLDTGAEYPARMPFADFTVEAVLMEGNDVAIDYPTITVTNTVATWDSNGGLFGSGSGYWGDYGSEFAMGGSVFDANFGKYVPKDEFDSAGDYGCYSFSITVSQEGSNPLTDTSYYEYSTSNSNDIWASVSSC